MREYVIITKYSKVIQNQYSKTLYAEGFSIKI